MNTTRKSRTTKTATQQATGAVLELPQAAFDLGNRWTIFGDGKLTINFPSVYVPMLEGQTPKRIKGETILITKEGLSFMVGTQANFDKSARIRMFDSDKIQDMPLFLMASVGFYLKASNHTKVTEVSIERLQINMTEGDQLASSIQKVLEKAHKFTLDGQEITIKVGQVNVFEEGLAAYKIYSKANPHTDANLLRAVLNVGGSTMDAILVDKDGDVLEHGFRSRKGGVSRLAELVQQHLIRQGFNVESKDLDLVMDALHNAHYPVSQGKDPDYSLLVVNGWDFSDVFPAILDAWFKQTLGMIKTTFNPYFPQIECFIWTGGGTYMLTEKLNVSPKFIMTPRPELDNVIGLLD